MLKKIYFTVIVALPTLLLGYDKPNSITFNPATKEYLISNLAGKSITRLDTNNTKTEVITGLIRPKDIMFASFGPYNGLLILDSNEVKVYDADSYSFITSLSVKGSIDLEDAELDKTTSNTFYISDPEANIIFKVVVGPAPFYTPTFTVLNTSVRRPKALLFDGKNRLLVTTDTLQSAVYAINTSTGNASLINTTSLDYINSLEEDLEGNYYATNWGDSYFYRLDKNFNNPLGIAQYSKPTGLFFNKIYDVIALACSNCNKVDFHKLHMVYINDVDTAKCPGDSFYVNINIQYKGKGTYNTGNVFYAELSDGNGKFTSPLILTFIKTVSEPNSYKVVLPAGRRFYGNKYTIRIRSTSPVFYSLNEIETMVPFVPLIDVSNKDTIYYCSSTTIKLGKAKDADSSLVNYLWFKDGQLQNFKTSEIEISETGIHKYKLIKQTKMWGCSPSDSVYTEQKNGFINIPFNDSIKVCQRADASIGGDSIANTSIRWTDKSDINFANSNYKFIVKGNANTINKTFTATVKSTLFGCEISKDVHLIYKNNPKFKSEIPAVPGFCTNTPVNLIPIRVSGDTTNMSFLWTPKLFLNNNKIKNPIYSNTINDGKSKEYLVITKDTSSQCIDSFRVLINNLIVPEKPIVEVNKIDPDSIKIRKFASEFIYSFKIMYSGELIDSGFTIDSIFTTSNFKNSKYAIITATNQICSSVSDTLFLVHFVNINKTRNLPIEIYPNPASDRIFIKSPIGKIMKSEINIFNYLGQCVLVSRPSHSGDVNIESLVPGIYQVRINFADHTYSSILIKR